MSALANVPFRPTWTQRDGNRFADPAYGETVRELTALLENEPDLMKTVFRPYKDGGDYWLNDGNGAGFAFNGVKTE